LIHLRRRRLARAAVADVAVLFKLSFDKST